MICKHCNSNVDDNLNFCTFCGSSLSDGTTNSTNQINNSAETYTSTTESAVNFANTQLNMSKDSNTSNSDIKLPSDYYRGPIDNPSHFAGIVSCCFPLVGFILYFLWKDEKPKSAKLVCNWLIAGIALLVVFYVVCFIIGIIAGIAESNYMYY